MIKQNKRRATTIIFGLVIFLLGVLMLAFPVDSSQAAKYGLNICLNVLIPSLFPFMVISVILTESGLSRYIFYIPSLILSKLSGLNEHYCNLFFIGMIGGYPSAAKNISICVNNGSIDPKTAETLLCFCTNSGPAFLITAVGSRMCLSSKIGIILFVSSFLSNVILLFFYSVKIKLPHKMTKLSKLNLSQSIVNSTKSCCESMGMISALVVIFSVLVSFIDKYFHFSQVLKTTFKGILEVTSGCITASHNSSIGAIVTISAMCGFGGICVILQIMSIVSPFKISIKKFVISRIFSAVLNMLFTSILLSIFPVQINQTFISNTSSVNTATLTAPLASVMLLLCCVCLPMCISKKKKI